MPYKDHLHGTLDALVLRTLRDGPRHGYAIVRWLSERSADAIRIEEGSLYPALYRMERDGWVDAEWGTSEIGRKAKIYKLTAKGRRQLRAETEQFATFLAAVSPILLPA
jgi:PadR family transcriptional regulator, regulatory protein PadR